MKRARAKNNPGSDLLSHTPAHAVPSAVCRGPRAEPSSERLAGSGTSTPPSSPLSATIAPDRCRPCCYVNDARLAIGGVAGPGFGANARLFRSGQQPFDARERMETARFVRLDVPGYEAHRLLGHAAH